MIKLKLLAIFLILVCGLTVPSAATLTEIELQSKEKYNSFVNDNIRDFVKDFIQLLKIGNEKLLGYLERFFIFFKAAVIRIIIGVSKVISAVAEIIKEFAVKIGAVIGCIGGGIVGGLEGCLEGADFGSEIGFAARRILTIFQISTDENGYLNIKMAADMETVAKELIEILRDYLKSKEVYQRVMNKFFGKGKSDL